MNLFKAFTKAFTAMRHTGAANFLLGFLSRTRFDYAKEVGTGIDSSVVTAPVQWIQRAFTEANLRVVKHKDDEIEEVENHDLVKLIDTPNPAYSGLHLWSATLFSYLTAGNAYWLKIRNNGGKLVELWYVPHWMMTPKWPDTGAVFISHYEYNHGVGTPAKVDPEDVVHFRAGIDPRNTRLGLSPLHGALREIFMDLEASNWVSSLLRNMGVPGLVISPDGDAVVSPDDATAVKKWFKEAFSGDRRGEALVMGSKTKVEQYGLNPQQMDLSVARDVAEERVCACLGIPAAIVGFGAGLQQTKVGATMNEMRRLAWINGIIPIHRSFADTLQRSLMPDFMRSSSNGAVVEFDTSQVTALEEDMNARAERWNTLVGGGLAMVSEGRRAMGLDVNPADEVYLRRLTTVEVPAGGSRQPLLVDKRGLYRHRIKSGHSEAEERLAAQPSHDPSEAQAAYQEVLTRQRPILIEIFERNLIGFFKEMGSEIAEIARPILKETFKQTSGDDLIVARIMDLADLPASEKALAGLYSAHYLSVAEAGGEAAEVMGLATGLPDPVAKAVIEIGGSRTGLIDITSRTRKSLFEALAEGREAGEGADALARRIRDGIPKGRWSTVQTRARVIARTETAYAQNTSTIERSRDAGIEKAMVFDDLVGFGDDICPQLDGIIVTLQEAEELAVDEHPNGTRSFSPHVSS